MSVPEVMAILVFGSAIVFGVLSCISAHKANIDRIAKQPPMAHNSGFGMFMNWLNR